GSTLIAHGDPTSLMIDVPSDDIDGHIAAVDQGGVGAKWFYHQGPDQSVLAVSGTNGLIEEGDSYSDFGEVTFWDANGPSRTKSNFGNRFLFQGQLFDSLTGTYSMRARQYQPAWGRFLSPDPLSTVAGPSLYAFAGSRPLHNRDPLGLLYCSNGTCYLNDEE